MVHQRPLYLLPLLLAFSLLVACDRKMPDAVISGGSMFPGMPGEHYRVVCDECQFEFKLDSYQPPKSGMAVCPNCGFAKIDFHEFLVQPATRPLLVPLGEVERWDVLAFENPSGLQHSKFLVKRVIGLPGEKISLENGNAFADGKLLQKPLPVFEDVRQVVFDSKYQAERSTVPRLSPEAGTSGWQNGSVGWVWKDGENGQGFDWLKYQHVRGYRHFGERFEVAPIEDNCSYNQNVSRKLFPASELQIEYEMTLDAEAEFCVRISNNVDIDFVFAGNQVWVKRNNRLNHSADRPVESRPVSISVAAFDDQVFVLCDEQIVLQESLSLGNGPTQIRLGARSGEIEVSRFRLFRDIHYLAMPENSDANGYFLLGDNPPISVDSQDFGRIHRQQLRAKVFPPDS